MSYVQQFQPKDNDLEVLRFFRSQKLSRIYNDPSDQQLVEQQVYDLARGGFGVKEGEVTALDLERAYQSLERSRQQMVQEQQRGLQPADSSHLGFDRIPVAGEPEPIAPHLLTHRTAQGSRLEHRTPHRHMNADDVAADAAGAFLYHLIDSATLGVLGFIGGGLKKLGATDKNFWTESVGEARSVLGMDFGRGGLKGADSETAMWTAGIGELAGFIGPSAGKIILKPAAKLVKGAAAAARAGKAKKLSDALTAGDIAEDLVPQTEKLIRHLRAGKASDIARAGKEAGQGVKSITAKTRIVEAGKAVDKAQEAAWKIAPARFVFQYGHKMADRAYRKGGKALEARLMGKAIDEGKTFGVVMNKARSEFARKAAAEAADQGMKAGYRVATKTSNRLLADGFEAAVLKNSAVNTQARMAFQREFIKQIGKRPEFVRDPKLLARLTENATGLFDDAWRASRKGGDLLTLAERAAKSGKTGLFSLGVRKAVEDASSHVANMVLLGAATRLSHPLAEPDLFGLEDASWGEIGVTSAKYWLRGNEDANPLFQGVIGDIWTGAAFHNAGGLRYLKKFQQRRVSNPTEVISTMFGGTPKGWNKILDETDRVLAKVYRTAPKKAGWTVRDYLSRNKVDYKHLLPGELHAVGTNYLTFLEEGGMKYVPALAKGAAPFTKVDLARLTRKGAADGRKFRTRTEIAKDPLAQESLELIETKMAQHLDATLRAYKRGMLGNVAKDLADFGVIATATAIASNPVMFKDLMDGKSDMHLSHVMTHSIFSMLAARHPYFLPDAPAMLGKARTAGNPMSDAFQEQVKLNGLRNSLRRFGIRDSAYFLQGDKVEHGPESAYGSRESTQDLNRIAEKVTTELERKRDLGEAADWNSYEIVKSINEVTSPETQITHREIEAIKNYVKGERARGADVHPMFLELDSGGRRYLIDSQEMFLPHERGTLEGSQYLQKLVATGIEMKQVLMEKGVLERNQELHHSHLRDANAEWSRDWVNTIRRVIESDSGLMEQMRRHLDDGGANEYLRKIRIVETLEDGTRVVSENPEIEKSVRAWNEVVELVSDLNGKSKAHMEPKEIRLAEEGNREVVQGIQDTITWFEGAVNKASGLTGDASFVLGRGYLHKSVVEAIRNAKINDATYFLEGGGLRNSDNEVFNVENVLDYMADHGFAYRDGEKIILKNYDASGIQDRVLRTRVVNLMRYLGQQRRVVRSSVQEGKLEASDLIRMTRNLEIGQAEGLGAKVSNKSIFEILDGLGIPTFSSGHMDGAIFDAARSRYSHLQPHHWTIHEMNKANALLVNQGTGLRVTPILIPKEAQRATGERAVELGAEFSEPTGQQERVLNWTADNLNEIAERVGRNDLKLGLTEELMKVWSEANEALTKAGIYDGWASETMRVEGADVVDQGVFTVYGEGSGSRALESIARTLHDVATRDRMAIEVEMAEAMNKMRQYADSKAASKRSRQKIRRLLMTMHKVRGNGGWAYQRVLMNMVDKGWLVMGEGYKAKKFKIPSAKEVAEMNRDINNFIEASNTSITFGRMAADRAADPVAREAFEMIRGGRVSKINPSNMLNSIGLTSQSGMAAGIKSVLDTYDARARGEFGPEQLAQKVRDGLTKVIKGAGELDLLDGNLRRLDKYRDNEILAMTTALTNSTEVPFWTVETIRETPTVALDGSTDGRAPERPDLAGTQIGNRVGKTRVAKKFWGRMADEVAPVHFVSSMVRPQTGGDPVDIYLEQNSDLRRSVMQKAFQGLLGVEKGVDGAVIRHQGKRLVMMDRASEEGGYSALEFPTDTALEIGGELTYRGKMARELAKIVEIYKDSTNAELNEAVETAEVFRDVLTDATFLELDRFYDGIESPGATGKYGNRLNMARTIAELIHYHRMFGEKLVKETFGQAAGLHHGDALTKLKARDKLVISDNIQGIDQVMAEALVGDYMRVHEKTPQQLEAAGITERGFKVATFDDVSLGEALGRGVVEGDKGKGSPITDSAIFVTPETMQLLHHMFGRNTVETSFGVGKLKFMTVGPDGGILGTKDALYVNPHITKVMNENGLGMIMSRSAEKLLSGAFADPRFTLQLEGGQRNLLEAVQKGQSLKMESESFELPFEAIDWQQEVDHNPSHAIIATNMSNYKDPAMVRGMSKRFFEQNIQRLQKTWDVMFGNSFSPESTQMLRELMIYELRREEGDPDRVRQVGWYMDYLTRGGSIASPNHFGMHRKALQAAMSSFITDTMFKGRSKFGTHAVYAPDVLGTVRPGEAVLPGQAANIVLDGDAIKTLTIGFDRADLREADDAKGIERINGDYWRWKEKERHFNSRASEDVPPQKPSYTQSVQLFGRGHQNGLGPGIMQMWRAGVGDRTRGSEIRGLVKKAATEADAQRLAAAINEGYQELVLSSSFDAGVENARKAIIDAIKGDLTWTDGGKEMRLTAEKVADNIINDLANVWSITRRAGAREVPQDVTVGSMMDGLSYLFGKYDYDTGRRGLVDFGLVAGGQRHPTSLPNDMIPLLVRGFLDRDTYGQQVLMSHWDAERVMKADFDKDEINFWFDNPRDVISGMQRIRGISSGFHEPEIPTVQGFRPFTTQRDISSHGLWTQRFREGKAAIGIIQRAVNTVSTMINKGVAFEYHDPYLDKMVVVEPLGDMKSIQSEYQGNMLAMAKKVNRFFDAKHGVPTESLADMDLQRDVLQMFFKARDKSVTGSESKLLELPNHAVEVLKGQMSLFSNMSSVTSGNKRFARDFDTLARTAARYSVVMQGSNPAQNLTNYTKLALSLGHPMGQKRRPYIDGFFNLEKTDQRRVDLLAKSDLKQILSTLRVVQPEWAKRDLLKTDSITDTIARSIRGYAGAIERGYEKSYMSALENQVIKSALDLSKSWDESLKAAEGQAWVLANDGQRGAIKELRRGLEYGEDHLAYEAAMSELEYRQYSFWEQRSQEAKFGQRQRWQPENGLESRTAINDSADGMAINLARGMVDDLKPTQAFARFERAMEIRQWHDRRFVEINKPGRQTLKKPTVESLELELDVKIEAYMREFGYGNEAAALLDLVSPMPFGYFYTRGNIMSRYKPFPQMLWRLGAKYGIPKSSVGRVQQAPELAEMSSSQVYQLMAASRALVEKSLDGDRHGLQQIRSWIETQQTNGKSFTAALNLSQIGGFPSRFRRMRENLFINMGNSEMRDIMEIRDREERNSLDYEGPEIPEPEIGLKSPRDAESLIYEATGGAPENIQRLKVLRAKQVNSGLWPHHLMRGIDGSESLIMKLVNFEPKARPGFWTSRAWDRTRSEVYAENRGEKLSKQDVTEKIRAKERRVMELLSKTLDARWIDGNLPSEGLEGSSISRVQERLYHERYCQ